MVVDASVMIAWLLNEPHLSLDDDIYGLLAEQTVNVPAHWPVEVCNALAVNVRRGRIRRDEIGDILEQLAHLDVVIAPPASLDGIGELTRFAITQELTVYDAAYVLLARDVGDTLATVDNDMRAVAQRFNIPLLPA